MTAENLNQKMEIIVRGGLFSFLFHYYFNILCLSGCNDFSNAEIIDRGQAGGIPEISHLITMVVWHISSWNICAAGLVGRFCFSVWSIKHHYWQNKNTEGNSNLFPALRFVTVWKDPKMNFKTTKFWAEMFTYLILFSVFLLSNAHT